MSGIKNPAKTVRAGLVSRVASKGKDRAGILWVFFAAELVITGLFFYFHKDDMLGFFKNILCATPVGGLIVMLEGIGESVIDNGGFAGIGSSLLQDYGQWLFAGLQSTGLILLMKNAQVCGMKKPLIYIHGVANTLFSGVLFYTVSDQWIVGKKGLILTVWENFKKHKTLTWKNLDLWLFVFMLLVIIFLLVMSCSSLVENFLYLMRNVVILGVIAAALVLLRAFIGSRVGNGSGGTAVEQFIVKYTKTIYGAQDMLFWLFFGIILLAIVGNAMKAISE